jgi:hypothetical protein
MTSTRCAIFNVIRAFVDNKELHKMDTIREIWRRQCAPPYRYSHDKDGHCVHCRCQIVNKSEGRTINDKITKYTPTINISAVRHANGCEEESWWSNGENEKRENLFNGDKDSLHEFKRGTTENFEVVLFGICL